MATPKEMLMTYLLEEGYNPLPDGEGIAFKKEGRTFSTFPDPGDPLFFNLYCYFDFEGRVPSRQAGLEAANDVNRSVKAIKVTLSDPANPSRVGFGVEAPLPLTESFRAIFDRCLHTIGYSAEQFIERLGKPE